MGSSLWSATVGVRRYDHIAFIGQGFSLFDNILPQAKELVDHDHARVGAWRIGPGDVGANHLAVRPNGLGVGKLFDTATANQGIDNDRAGEEDDESQQEADEN